MRLGIAYDIGEGPTTVQISPRAVVGWELKSGRRISDLATGFGIDDQVELLWQQLKIGPEPCPWGARAALLADLVEIDVVVGEAGSNGSGPTEEGAPAD